MTLLALTVACSQASVQTLTVTANDDGRTIELKRGAQLAVELDANPATGYSWILRDSASGILQSSGTPPVVRDPASAQRVGAGGVQTWVFTATNAGNGTLRFEYLRPWERDKPPARALTFRASVSSP